MRYASNIFYLNKDVKYFFGGGTWITLEAAIYYQMKIRDISITTSNENTRVTFNWYTPSLIYSGQNYLYMMIK